MAEWETKKISDIFKDVNSSETGLDETTAQDRLKEFGPNKLPAAKVDGLLTIWLRQFQSPLIYILILASVLIFLLGETTDSLIIVAVLLFNAIVGAVQEGRAQNTMLALNRFVETKATVWRSNRELIVPDSEVVPGDIIILAEGEKIPADARLLAGNNLTVDEAALTGESKPVHKFELSSDAKSDKSDVLYKGTHVVAGNGKAVVVATGEHTVIGKIAKAITLIDGEIPLKADIRHLSSLIIKAVLGISLVMFTLGWLAGNSARHMFATVVSLAVSVIPEGLPIVVTLTLATGVWRMSKRRALVKKLQAVEALGQAKTIAVDKTGTLTRNELVVQKIYLLESDVTYDVSGVGYESVGNLSLDGHVVEAANHPQLQLLARAVAISANARTKFDENTKLWQVTGDPTEAALLVLGEKLGVERYKLLEENPIVAEQPFDYKLKYHTVLQGTDNPLLALVGAPEAVTSLVTFKDRLGYQRAIEIYENLSRQGFRVLAVAIETKIPKSFNIGSPRDLTLLALVAMKDAIRPEVAPAMAQAIKAGVNVVMITGDNGLTARAIAAEAGIYKDGDEVLTGGEIDKLSNTELDKKIGKVSVFARVTPEHKLKIIEAYRRRGEIIAMTGDGVNDAPSLVAADLGVAMGKIGTEVAKEASDIILLDDNFGSIISAIEEGRSIYRTIKKVILYLFSTSFGLVIVISGAILFGLPLPLLPVQIIWLNFVTDGFLDVSLAMEPKDKDLLAHKAASKVGLLDGQMARRMVTMALPMALGSLYVFSKYLEQGELKAWTASLTVLAVFQWFNAWNCRSDKQSIFTINPLTNKYLIASTFIVIVLQLAAVYTAPLQNILRTTHLELADWALIMGVASSIIITEEIRKFFARWLSRDKKDKPAGLTSLGTSQT